MVSGEGAMGHIAVKYWRRELNHKFFVDLARETV